VAPDRFPENLFFLHDTLEVLGRCAAIFGDGGTQTSLDIAIAWPLGENSPIAIGRAFVGLVGFEEQGYRVEGIDFVVAGWIRGQE